MIDTGKAYTRRPGNLGAKGGEGLDQDGGLDCHVQASSNASALERLGSSVLLPHVHETWHLVLSDFDFLASKGGKGDIYNAGSRSEGAKCSV